MSRKFKLILLLITITFFTYFPSFSNPFIWDDEQFITSNHYVQNFDIGKIFTTSTTAGGGVVSNYYRPFTSLSFAIDTKIWSFGSAQDKGLNPFGFHLTNLLFHTGAGILLFLFLEEVGISGWGSFFISLFFLVHPIQTEAVTYINSRGDSMYAFFLFGALVLFALGLKYRTVIPVRRYFVASTLGVKAGIQSNRHSELDSESYKKDSWIPDQVGDDKKKGFWMHVVYQNDILWGLGVLALYLLSILSKETAMAAFPLFFILILLNILKNKEKFSQSIHAYAKPIFVAILTGLVAAGYFALRLTVLNFQDTLNYYGGTTFYSTHLFVRLFTFAKVLGVYLGLLIWPYPLHMERSVDLVTMFFSPWVLGMVGLLGVLGMLGFLEIRKRKTAWILFGLVLSACMLLPVSGIIPINGILYEHWLYMPFIGVLLIAYGLLLMVSQKLHAIRNMLYAICFALAIIYIVLTIHQNTIWADPVTFYRYTLQFAPDSARLHNNLGMSLADKGDNKGAIIEYKKALSLGWGYPQIYNNLGNAEMEIGEYKEAESNVKKALELAPGFGVAKTNLIKVYLFSKQYDKAQELSGNDPQVEEIIRQLEGK